MRSVIVLLVISGFTQAADFTVTNKTVPFKVENKTTPSTPKLERFRADSGVEYEKGVDGIWREVVNGKGVQGNNPSPFPQKKSVGIMQGTPAHNAEDHNTSFPGSTATGHTITPVVPAVRLGTTRYNQNCSSGG